MAESQSGSIQNPWASGPVDLLEHAVDHLKKGQFFDLRIAMISIDNAVELIAKAYLAMPESARGCPGPPKKEYEEKAKTFPGLLELIEKYAKDRLSGIPLADLYFYHELRNKLYHEHHPLSPKPDLVDTYLQIAKLLLKQLLGSRGSPAVNRLQATSRGQFLLAWKELLDRVFGLADRVKPRAYGEGRSLHFALRILEENELLLHDAKERLVRIGSVRNDTAHGTGGLSEDDLADVIPLLYSLMGELNFAQHQLAEKPLPAETPISNEAKELLVTALPSGELQVFEVDQLPTPWIRVGRVDYLREGDPSFATRYFDALKELLQEGYARHISRQRYVLTSAGFDRAQEVAGP